MQSIQSSMQADPRERRGSHVRIWGNSQCKGPEAEPLQESKKELSEEERHVRWGGQASRSQTSLDFTPPGAGVWITLPTWVGCPESMESMRPIRHPWRSPAWRCRGWASLSGCVAGSSEVLWPRLSSVAVWGLHLEPGYCKWTLVQLHRRCLLTTCQMAAQLVTHATGFEPIKWAKRVVNKE